MSERRVSERSAENPVRQIVIIAGLLLLLTTVGTLGIHLLTEVSWLEACYMAVVILTTVGSRDVPPEADVMLFVIIYLVCGLGAFTYSAFQLGSILVNANIRNVLGRRRMERELVKLRDHYIVCGAGRMGLTICEYLANRKQPFVVVDHSEELLADVCGEKNWPFIVGDATHDEVLRAAGVERARALATVLATDADNLYVVLSARLLSDSIQIVARATERTALQKLQRAGASRVISPFSSGGIKMARFMLSPSIEDFLEFTDETGSSLELVELQIDEKSSYVGQTLAQTDLREQGVMVIGIRRADGGHVLAPGGDARVEAGDRLFTFGRSQAVMLVAGSRDEE